MAHTEGARGAGREFPGVAWGPVLAGVLLALAAHVVLGLVGGAMGLAADPADSPALGAAAGFWALLTPLVSTALGAWLACRLAGRQDEAGANLQGVMVWAVGLLAGAVFLAGTAVSGAMAGTAAGAGALSGLPGAGAADPAAALGEAAARRAAAATGAAAMAALCGLIGAFVGAAFARPREGLGLRRGLGWRIAIQRTERPPRGSSREEADPAVRGQPREAGADVREVSRQEGPGAPPVERPPYHH